MPQANAARAGALAIAAICWSAGLFAPAKSPAAAVQTQVTVVGKTGIEIAAGDFPPKAAKVKVGRKSCAVPAGTPLAALLAAANSRKAPRVKVSDYGSCGKASTSAGGLYVKGVGKDVAAGRDGWVYKIGDASGDSWKSGTAAAADPHGPFGDGHKLANRQRVLWFWCELSASGKCQETLGLKVMEKSASTTPTWGPFTLSVHRYDDAGSGKPFAGASVESCFALAAGKPIDCHPLGVTDKDGLLDNITLPNSLNRVAYFVAQGNGAVPAVTAINLPCMACTGAQ